MSKKLIAAADGSALGNPGPAGWAWYIDENRWAAGGWKRGTNNMGELKAVLDVFEATAGQSDLHLHVICDSQYTIKSITEWMPGWKKKGWKKSDGKPVLNVDLMQALDRAIAGRTYSFEWVKGHTGHPLNEAADSRARAAAEAYRDGVSPQTGPGMGQDSQATQAATAAETSQAAEPGLAAQEAKVAQPSKTANTAKVTDTATMAETVREQEAATLNPAIYGSHKLLGALLHPELNWVAPNGQVFDRETVLKLRERACASAGQPQELNLVPLGPASLLLVSQVPVKHGTIVRSSLWEESDGSWKLRYRQDTGATS